MSESTAMIRIGELARATGLSVRALHHYEQIGLLEATARTPAGHRVYGPQAVARVYRLIRLRDLGLSLGRIRSTLDDPGSSLGDALRTHLAAVDEHIAALTSVRAGVHAALTHLDQRDEPSPDLLEVLTTMDELTKLIRRRISIMVYRDPAAAHRYLTEVFGLTAGEVTTDPDGRVVHAEIHAGDGDIWLHPETAEYRLASPATLGSATASIAVLVDDVDEHHAFVLAQGGDVVYPPVDQPYGYREYSARDSEGSLWSFMKALP